MRHRPGRAAAARRSHSGSDERRCSTSCRDASADVRRPLLFATLIALLAIVPVAVLGGRPGAFFAPLVLAYALAVAAAIAGRASPSTPALTALLFAALAAATGRVAPGAADADAASRYVGGARAASRGWPCRGRPRSSAGAGRRRTPPSRSSARRWSRRFQDRDVLVRLDGAPGTSNPRDDARSRPRWRREPRDRRRCGQRAAPTSAAPSPATASSTSTRATSGSPSTATPTTTRPLAAIEAAVGDGARTCRPSVVDLLRPEDARRRRPDARRQPRAGDRAATS